MKISKIDGFSPDFMISEQMFRIAENHGQFQLFISDCIKFTHFIKNDEICPKSSKSWKIIKYLEFLGFIHFHVFLYFLNFIEIPENANHENRKGYVKIMKIYDFLCFSVSLGSFQSLFFRKEILISFHFIRFAQIEALENRKGYAKIFKIMIFHENLCFS